MKKVFTLVICASAILFYPGCKKDNSVNQSFDPALIVGKWYENKLTLTQTNTNTSTTADTTFQSQNFTPGDFFNFSAADSASV